MTPDVQPKMFTGENYHSSDSPSGRVEPKRGDGSARGRRGGYVMVLLAMMLFGIFAMAALVIDIGFARLTQRQMQTAADAAALEGLRSVGDPSSSFEIRQDAAVWFVTLTFDDDLDAGNGDDGIASLGGPFGVGPLVDFTAGAGAPDLAASQLMTVDPVNITYKPDIQKGDESVDAFKVNLVRSGQTQSAGDIFAQGPPVPYLFARGSLINRELIASGITVRAEAVANPMKAIKVGSPVPNFPGAVAIGYAVDDWNQGGTNPQLLDQPALQLGQPVTSNGTATTLADGYCSIFSDISGTNYVVGFGWIKAGSPITQSLNVAPGNATCRLSEVWHTIQPGVRDQVILRAASVINGLQVPSLTVVK